MVSPVLQLGKLRLGFPEAPSGGNAGHRGQDTCLLGPVLPPPESRALLGVLAVDPGPCHLKAGSGTHVMTLLPSPAQVSWAAPSHLSDTAPTISKSSITSAAPSRKVPPCPLVPWWQLQVLGVMVKVGRGRERRLRAVGTRIGGQVLGKVCISRVK